MSVFILKLIAVITMTIDHTGAIFENHYDLEIFRVIGRIAFPIYAFLISEGCKHTKNIKKYLLRLGIFALISEVPFDIMCSLAESGRIMPFNPRSANVYFTLFSGAFLIFVYSFAKKLLTGSSSDSKDTAKDTDKKAGFHISLELIAIFIVSLIVAFCTLYLVDMYKADYDILGTLLIFSLYITKNKTIRFIVLSIALYLIYGGSMFIYSSSHPYFYMFIASLIAAVFIIFYNGKKGLSAKPMQYVFYAYYPAHMIILSMVYYYMIIK